MGLAKHDDMVGALAADGSNRPLGDAVIKSTQLHLFRSIERKPSRSLMSSIPFTGVSSRS